MCGVASVVVGLIWFNEIIGGTMRCYAIAVWMRHLKLIRPLPLKARPAWC